MFPPRASWRATRMSRVVRGAEGTVVEMHDNPCATPEDHEKVREQLIQAGRSATRLVVDCAAVNVMVADFLSVLLVAFKALACRPGDLVLCRLRAVPRQVFALTALDRILPIYETRQQALEAPWPEPVPHLVEEAGQGH